MEALFLVGEVKAKQILNPNPIPSKVNIQKTNSVPTGSRFPSDGMWDWSLFVVGYASNELGLPTLGGGLKNRRGPARAGFNRIEVNEYRI
jgi:hypothetical protein